MPMIGTISEPELWQALATRNQAYDGRFLYGVITTGVFCKPSCPARPARPENIRFYATAADAEKAGLRACKRCRPLEDSDAVAEKIQAAARYIAAHADETLPLAKLARQAGLSSTYFQKKFVAAFGVSPRVYQHGLRLSQLKTSLRAGESVTGAIFDAGFGSTSRVYGSAARTLGMTPSAYRAGGAGETIAYACRMTALGHLMMAATDKGVCFAQFGDSDAQLRSALAREFPKAQLVPSDAGFSPALNDWIAAVDAHVSRHAALPDCPLDLRGTAFQIKVWQFLLSVQEGDVVSYSDVATAIKAPSAARAAASACGANRIAVLVPCHRVLRSNGDLGGYRWGLDRKRSLIDTERQRKSTLA